MQQIVWEIPSTEVALGPDEVHVWCASLNVGQATIQRLRSVLSADEIEKAERFYFQKDRTAFIVARGLLRRLLGHYLRREPRDMRFNYSRYGKPAVDPSPYESELQFNVSHSHQLALIIFAYGRLVGIDVEYMRKNVEYEELAPRFFSLAENVALNALPEAQKREAFFHCWTRKEAYIKARGEGLSLPLDLFDVSLRPGEPAALLGSREDPREVARWSLQALASADDYASALIVEGHGWHLRCWEWQEDSEIV